MKLKHARKKKYINAKPWQRQKKDVYIRIIIISFWHKLHSNSSTYVDSNKIVFHSKYSMQILFSFEMRNSCDIPINFKLNSQCDDTIWSNWTIYFEIENAERHSQSKKRIQLKMHSTHSKKKNSEYNSIDRKKHYFNKMLEIYISKNEEKKRMKTYDTMICQVLVVSLEHIYHHWYHLLIWEYNIEQTVTIKKKTNIWCEKTRIKYKIHLSIIILFGLSKINVNWNINWFNYLELKLSYHLNVCPILLQKKNVVL